MMPASGDARIGGVCFAKLFPNLAEPFRGLFVADQIRATKADVNWSVIAPVPWVPHAIARRFGKPYARGIDDFEGIRVARTRHAVLPRRVLYNTVADSMAISSAGAFRHAVAEVGARFVHCHELYPAGAAARRLAAKAGLPYVVTVHGSDLYLNLDTPSWRREITRTAADADAVICVGRRLALDAVDAIGLDPARTVVIPNTYDTNRFELTAHKAHPGPVRLLCVGRLSPEKGHEVLLRSFAALVAAGTDAELTLVGGGVLEGSLRELAMALGINVRVRFAGIVVGRLLAEEYARADLFVLPSLSEGFGVSVVEAMACGLPVVATRSGGPDGIVDDASGVLVAPGDADALAHGISRAIAGLADFDRPAIAAAAAARYSPEAVGAALVRLYREVLAGEPLTGSLAADLAAVAGHTVSHAEDSPR